MRRAVSALALVVTSALAFVLTSAPAAAALKLCNRTSYILYAATGTGTADTVETKGWTRVVPGACATAIADKLGKADYYVYARTSQAHDGPAQAWGGKTELCAREGPFALKSVAGAQHCGSDDSFAMPFRRIDTKGQADWTTAFTQTPPLKTTEAARNAGLARLLADLGETRPASYLPKTLDAFRTRMNIPKNASDAALFDALETEALKVAAPAGYSICNDTNGPIWAAIGVEEARAWHSRGWWQVQPGACAHALTTALHTDAVYLLAEDAKGKKLVQGKDGFCITQIAFDVEKRGQCKERGLVATGFARTLTKGRTGYAAHVSEDGLLPPLSNRLE